MSRLRARTWTALERRVMHRRAEMIGHEIPNKVSDSIYGYPGIPCEILPFRELAACIIRTKGVDLRLARLRALGDAENRIDSVTGASYEELTNIEFVRDFKRNMDRSDRYCYHRDARRRSRYSNRKRPLRPVPPMSKISLYDISWVRSDSNPNIYVRRDA